MTLRQFGVLLLIATGVLPLVIAGLLMIERARSAALDEIRRGNLRVAERAAAELDEFVGAQLDFMATLAPAMGPAVSPTPGQAEHMLKNYRIAFEHLRELDVVEVGSCHELATGRLDGVTRSRCGEAAVEAARRGETFRGAVSLSEDLAPLMTLARPLEVAGEPVGVAVAVVDMVGIWENVNAIRVGETGHARLVADDGVLIAHGDPEERRRVFLREKDPFLVKIRDAGPGGERYQDSQGREVLAVAAGVAGLPWTVIVEQPVAEALRGVSAMQRDLLVVVAAAVALAVVIGFGMGRGPIRALEGMRAHAAEVGRGNLAARVEPPRLAELGALARGLNDMSSELDRLHTKIRAEERLATFAQVAAGLAHDLQTPIETVRGACGLAVAEPDDPEARELLRAAAEQHLPRLQRYVRDLRRLAQEGQVPLELQSVDPRLLLEEVARTLRDSRKWRGLDVVTRIDAHHVLADESLLSRALVNLAANAADACMTRRPPGGTVTLVAHDTDGDVTFEVRDTGVGMTPEQLAAVMEHDFRSTKRQAGIGLGLGVARHVVRAHGGSLTAESRLGEGTVFRVTLPRSDRERRGDA